MPGIRDRSVVRSSVIPSAKYCWSGSLLRLAKGTTTIDRRGAAKGCEVEAAIGIPAVEDGGAGHSHHARPATTSDVEMAAVIIRSLMPTWRDLRHARRRKASDS